MTFEFAEVAIPARQGGPGRPAEPNPFLDEVARLLDAEGVPRDVAVSFVLPDGPDSEAANRTKRQLARAGIAHNVSIFKKLEDVGEGTRFTFWAQTRIIPQRRVKNADANGNGAGADELPDDEASEALGFADVTTDNVTHLEP
jgi:hypothetical protein